MLRVLVDPCAVQLYDAGFLHGARRHVRPLWCQNNTLRSDRSAVPLGVEVLESPTVL